MLTGYGAARGSCGGWSTYPGAASAVGRPFAGKTGTTDDTRAAWFVGFTPDLAAASFIADPDNPHDVAGDGNHWKPNQTVTDTVRGALAGAPIRYFTPPPAKVVGVPQHVTAPKSAAKPGAKPAAPAKPGKHAKPPANG